MLKPGQFYVLPIKTHHPTGKDCTLERWFYKDKKYLAEPSPSEHMIRVFNCEDRRYKNEWASFYKKDFEMVGYQPRKYVVFDKSNVNNFWFFDEISYDKAEEKALIVHGKIYELKAEAVEKEVTTTQTILQNV